MMNMVVIFVLHNFNNLPELSQVRGAAAVQLQPLGFRCCIF